VCLYYHKWVRETKIIDITHAQFCFIVYRVIGQSSWLPFFHLIISVLEFWFFKFLNDMLINAMFSNVWAFWTWAIFGANNKFDDLPFLLYIFWWTIFLQILWSTAAASLLCIVLDTIVGNRNGDRRTSR